MFSREKKVLFIHIPKTGGSTISARLGPELFNTTLGDFNANLKKYLTHEGEWVQHFSYSDHQKIISNIESFFAFAFVRNPYDRIVSEYLYVKNNGCTCKEPQTFSFEEFLEKGMSCAFGRHKFTQKSFLLDSEGKLAVKNIFNFESFESEFTKLCDILDIYPAKLVSRNINKSRTNYKLYYNNTTKEMVESLFKEDINFLNYDFERGQIKKAFR